MKIIVALFITFITCLQALATAYTSTQSGPFSANATWGGGGHPSASGDTFTISTGNTVLYDVNNQTQTGWGASTVTGTLNMANGATGGGPVYFLMNGNLSGTGSWTIGTNGNPITYSATNSPNVYIQFTNSAQCTMSTARMLAWYGTSHVYNAYLSSAVAVGATSIIVSNVPAWLGANDVFWMAPTNTTQGQGGDYYIVSSVSGSGPYTINIVTSYPTGQSNFFPGITFSSSVPTKGRTVGTQVGIFGASVVILEPQQRAVSTFTSSFSNSVTQCCLQNLGKGLASTTSCNGWNVFYSSANNCNNGGLAYSSCNGWNASYNTANNCANGGLASSSCVGWNVFYNTANNCNNGGLASSSCVGWNASYNTANNCDNGGLAVGSCSGWNASYNTANNCVYGGLACNSCNGWNVSYNTANNCANGGLDYGYSSGWTVLNCTNISSNPLFLDCWNILAFGTQSTGDSIGGTAYTSTYFQSIEYGYTNWIDLAGWVTNVAGTNVHACAAGFSNSPVPLTVQFELRPLAYRNVYISTMTSNNVQYYAGVNVGYAIDTNFITEVNTGGTTGNWTNTTLSITNSSGNPLPCSLWIYTQGGVTSNGYSIYNIGQDMIVNQY